MPSRPKITGRVGTLASTFVRAIVPYHVDEDALAKLFERVGINKKECVYCGTEATDRDHLRRIVENGRPSGHFHTIDNLVPSCGRCNQSKGTKDWKSWMQESTPKSLIARNVSNIQERIDRLLRFEQEAGNKVGMSQDEQRDIVGPALWNGYWQKLEKIKALMAEAQKDADEIHFHLNAASKNSADDNSN